MGACGSKDATPGGKQPGRDDSQFRRTFTASRGNMSPAQIEEVDNLVSIPFFAELTHARLKEIHNLFDRREIPKGEFVFEEKSEKKDDIFHTVISGSFQVSSLDKDGNSRVNLHELKKGDWFGSVARVDDDVHYVSVQALTDSVVLSMPISKFEEHISKHKDLSVSVCSLGNMTPIHVQLKDIAFLANLEEAKLQKLAALVQLRRVKAGEAICWQGDVADGFYYIIDGRVDVSAAGPEGQDVHLSTLKSKDWFGEIALIENVNRTANITTSQDTSLLFLNKERFKRFLELAPEVLESGVFQQMIRTRTANSLKAIPLFSVFKEKDKGPVQKYDETKLALLGALFRFVYYEKDAVIFREGDEGDTFLLVISGKCHLSAKSPDGEEIELGVLTENDWIGDTQLLYSTRRTVTVVAEEPCVMLQLEKKDFGMFLSIAPELENVLKSRVGQRTATRLKRMPFFQGLKENRPWSKLDLLGTLFVFERMDDGEVVFNEGDKGEKFYILVEGSCNVFVDRGDGAVVIDTLNPGDYFGEIALLRDTPRTASIRCIKDCLFITLSAEPFKKFLGVAPELTDKFQSMAMTRTANTLKTIGMFQEVKENKPWSKLELLATLFNYVQYDKGQVVQDFGSPPANFYLIVKGSVQILGRNPDGEEIKGVELKEQDHFGEDGLLQGRPSETKVVTLTPCVFLYLPKRAFKQFVSIAPELQPHLKRSVNRRRQSVMLSEIEVDLDEYARRESSIITS